MLTPMLPEDVQKDVKDRKAALYITEHIVEYRHRELARYTGKHVILLGTGCNFIDIAGAEMLEIEQRRLRDAGGSLSMCGFRMYALEVMERGGFLERMGRENYFHTAEAAIASLRDSVAEAHRAHGDQPAACPDCQLFGPAGIGPRGCGSAARDRAPA